MPLNLTEVDGAVIQAQHKASCHCGAVQLLLDLPNGLQNIRRCDCSMCSRRGAIAASIPLASLHITQGSGELKLYQFNTFAAKHYFCSQCGIYTHHQRRSDPTEYAVNVACLEDVNALKIQAVPTIDGINHIADR